MHPILVKIGPVTIHTYGFLLAVGVLCGFAVGLYLGKKENLDKKRLADFMIYSILVGLVGAKVWHFLTNLGHYLKHPGEMPSLLNMLTSAGAFHGGIVFGVLFVVWYVRKYKLDFKVIGDVLAPAVALAHFFGRMGCFSAGCCWGREAPDSPIALKFTSPETTTGVPHGVPLYPTQLIEAILNLINFVILMVAFKKKKFKGQVFMLYIFNYSLIRFFVEFFRGDDDRGYIFGGIEHPFTSLSVPQLVSIIGIIVAIVLYKKFKEAAAIDTEEDEKIRRKEKKKRRR